jgi:hypothetical protein
MGGRKWRRGQGALGTAAVLRLRGFEAQACCRDFVININATAIIFGGYTVFLKVFFSGVGAHQVPRESALKENVSFRYPPEVTPTEYDWRRRLEAATPRLLMTMEEKTGPGMMGRGEMAQMLPSVMPVRPLKRMIGPVRISSTLPAVKRSSTTLSRGGRRCGRGKTYGCSLSFP